MGPEAEPRSTPARPRFAASSTALYAVLWWLVVAHGWGGLISADPASWLHHPDRSAARMTGRDLELAEAVEARRGPLRPLLDRLYGSRDETLERAIDIHDELIASADDSAATRLRLAILLRAAERTDEAEALLAGSSERLEPAATGSLPEPFRDLAERDRARGAGDGLAAAAAEARLLARGQSWMWRSLAMQGVNLVLVTIGSGVLVTWLLRRRRTPDTPAVAPWPFADGIGVFVRGEFWNRSYFLVLVLVSAQPLGAVLDGLPGSLLFGWGTLFASLPLLWLVGRHLLAPNRLRAGSAFGRTGGRGARALLAVGLAALAVDLVGTHAISWGAWWLGSASSWAEGFDETLVWGTGLEAAATGLDYVLWAPVLEELSFRGVLYFSLRKRLGPVPAALTTSLLFAGLHFYSLPGFLMTLWSGFVWALAFERSRSLLPGIAAHAVYNGLFVAGLVLVYR